MTDKCDCESCQDCGSRRELAVNKFAKLLKDNPDTKAKLDILGGFAAKIRDIIISDDNLANSLFEGESLDLMAFCPNSTEMIVIRIEMITQLPAHELEMIHEL